MSKRSFFFSAILVVLVAGFLVATFGPRPALDNAQTTTNQSWKVLQAPLNVRYQKLADLGSAIKTTGSDKDALQQLSSAQKAWKKAGGNKNSANAATQVPAAVGMESAAGRLLALASNNPKLKTDPAVQSAKAEFVKSVPLNTNIRSYNHAATSYEQLRRSPFRKLTVMIFSYKPRLEFELVKS